MAKVLVVDDSTELLDLFSLLLAAQGHEVETANSKNTFIDRLPVFIPDIILLDVKLDGVDGRELCKEIKSKSPHKDIPIILLSANPALLESYEECGAVDVIEKPFNIKTVTDKVKFILEKDSV